jgi:hypothetical protein
MPELSSFPQPVLPIVSGVLQAVSTPVRIEWAATTRLSTADQLSAPDRDIPLYHGQFATRTGGKGTPQYCGLLSVPVVRTVACALNHFTPYVWPALLTRAPVGKCPPWAPLFEPAWPSPPINKHIQSVPQRCHRHSMIVTDSTAISTMWHTGHWPVIAPAARRTEIVAARGSKGQQGACYAGRGRTAPRQEPMAHTHWAAPAISTSHPTELVKPTQQPL